MIWNDAYLMNHKLWVIGLNSFLSASFWSFQFQKRQLRNCKCYSETRSIKKGIENIAPYIDWPDSPDNNCTDLVIPIEVRWDPSLVLYHRCTLVMICNQSRSVFIGKETQYIWIQSIERWPNFWYYRKLRWLYNSNLHGSLCCSYLMNWT